MENNKEITKENELSRENLISALQEFSAASFDCGECRGGGNWNTAKLLYRYLDIRGCRNDRHQSTHRVQLRSLDSYATLFGKVAEWVKGMEKDGYVIEWKRTYLATGGRDCFGIDRTIPVEVPVHIEKAELCDDFKSLKAKVESMCGISLTGSEIYQARAVRKRNDVSVSGKQYLYRQAWMCRKIAQWLDAHVSTGDKVEMTIDTYDDFDGQRPTEYEQYGRRYSFPHFIVKGKGGAVKAESDMFIIY